MTRKILSKSPKVNVFKKPTLFHFLLVAFALIAAIWLYYKLFSKNSVATHLENFVGKESFFNGVNNCEKSDKPFKLMFFFMETCPHCVDFKPHWKEFVNDLTKQEYASKICVADISTENEDLLKKYDVHSFPTVLLIKPDKSVISFEGDRTKEGLDSFVKSNVA